MVDVDPAAAAKRAALEDLTNKGSMSGGYDKVHNILEDACLIACRPDLTTTCSPPRLLPRLTSFSFLADIFAQGSRGVAPVVQPANMRVTRQRAARERQLQQQKMQIHDQLEQPSAGEPMAVETVGFNLDPLSQRDPQLCHHYTKEIYSYLRGLEMDHRVSPHYMQVHQTGLHTLNAPLLLTLFLPRSSARRASAI